MKKLSIIVVLSGCAPIGGSMPVFEIRYSQDSKDCLYEEASVDQLFSDGELVGKDVLAVRQIRYENTPCRQVVDSDLKNGINKTVISDGVAKSYTSISTSSAAGASVSKR